MEICNARAKSSCVRLSRQCLSEQELRDQLIQENGQQLQILEERAASAEAAERAQQQEAAWIRTELESREAAAVQEEELVHGHP